MKLPKKGHKALTHNQVQDLRKVVEALIGELPHLPLLLELVLLGMSRRSISTLTLDQIHSDEIHWQNRKNVKIVTKLTQGQVALLEEYLFWRKSRRVKHNYLIIVRQTSYFKDGHYLPIKEERVRSDIRVIGREIGLDYNLEIPEIHKAISNYLLSSGIPIEVIKKRYKLY
jgi:hypothetical protein